MASLSFCLSLDADVPSCRHHSLTGWHRGWRFLLLFFSFRTDRWLAGCHVPGAMASPLPSVPLYFLCSTRFGYLLFCTMGWFRLFGAGHLSGRLFIRTSIGVISWVIIYLSGHLDWRTGNWTAGPGWGDTQHMIKGRSPKLGEMYSVRPGLGGKVCHCVLS